MRETDGQLSEMVIRPKEIMSSDGTEDPVYNEFEMAYVYCYDESSQYFVSLSRCTSDELPEIMVLDQRCYKTGDLNVELKMNELRISMPPALAELLDGIAFYRIQYNFSREKLDALHSALGVVFRDGSHGVYTASFRMLGGTTP